MKNLIIMPAIIVAVVMIAISSPLIAQKKSSELENPVNTNGGFTVKNWFNDGNELIVADGKYQKFGIWDGITLSATNMMNPVAARNASVVYAYDLGSVIDQPGQKKTLEDIRDGRLLWGVRENNSIINAYHVDDETKSSIDIALNQNIEFQQNGSWEMLKYMPASISATDNLGSVVLVSYDSTLAGKPVKAKYINWNPYWQKSLK